MVDLWNRIGAIVMFPKINIWSTGTFLLDWMISFDVFLKMFLTLNGYGTAMNGSLEPHSRAWCSQATNDPGTPTLVATTYSGRLAEEQMEKSSVFNRDYFE